MDAFHVLADSMAPALVLMHGAFALLFLALALIGSSLIVSTLFPFQPGECESVKRAERYRITQARLITLKRERRERENAATRELDNTVVNTQPSVVVCSQYVVAGNVSIMPCLMVV